MWPRSTVHLRRARRAAQRADWAHAISCYERALAGGSDRRSWWAEYASVLEQAERWGEAADALERSLTSADPGEPFAELADLRVKAGDLRAATTAFQVAVERSPDVAAWHGKLARLYERQGDHPAAVVAYRKAIDRAPEVGGWHRQLGRTLAAAGDLDAAVAAYRDAVELEPARAGWHYQLGRLLERAERWNDAAAAYQRAVDLQPDRVAWHGRLGGVRRRSGAWCAAARAYEDAAYRDVEEPDWWFRAGAAYERARDWTRAAEAFRTADRHAAGIDADAPAPSSQLPYDTRIHLGLLRKPAYAYLLMRSADLAKQLGIDHIAALEFGVAGGNGLLAMEMHAEEVTAETGVRIDVIGFDTGQGLYEPVDYRDMPYFFAAGLYSIDEASLRSRLHRARLILGDAAVTFPEYLAATPRVPVGTMSFDMDVYSATAAVLRQLGDDVSHDRFLPRTSVYFDDVFGHEGQAYNRFTGELLAIDEYNEANRHAKLAEDRTFRSLPISFGWQHGIYTLHRFQHPEYDTFISPATADSLRLRD